MERRPVYHCLNLRKDNLVIPDILCQAYVDVIHKRFQLTPFVVTNGAIVIHTQRLKSDPGVINLFILDDVSEKMEYIPDWVVVTRLNIWWR